MKPIAMSFIFDEYEGLRQYVDGKVDSFDFIDVEEFCLNDMNEIIREIGYKHGLCYYHYLVPENNLDDGLRALVCDMHIDIMKKYAPKYKQIDVFVEHGFGISIAQIREKTPELEPIRENVVETELENEPIRKNVVSLEETEAVEVNEDSEIDGEEEKDNETDGEEDSQSRSEGDDSEDVDFELDKDRDVGDDEDSEEVNEANQEGMQEPKGIQEQVGMQEPVGMQAPKAVEFTPHIDELNVNEEMLGIGFDDFDSGPNDDTI
uniref:histone chaperone ASF1-like n=1 Tax=Erigeron canadensis TaxID=72917 RepID=UPI001CB8B902|nr:histone chaperone ASF1-like [Erigeron canadensis]